MIDIFVILYNFQNNIMALIILSYKIQGGKCVPAAKSCIYSCRNTKNMTIDQLMDNLRVYIGRELGVETMMDFSLRCGISYKCLCDIIYKETKSIDCKTLIKICENSNISYSDLFEISDSDIFESMIKKINLQFAGEKYIIQKDRKK